MPVNAFDQGKQLSRTTGRRRRLTSPTSNNANAGEDLFLTLAADTAQNQKTDSPKSPGRSERRRSSIAVSTSKKDVSIVPSRKPVESSSSRHQDLIDLQKQEYNSPPSTSSKARPPPLYTRSRFSSGQYYSPTQNGSRQISPAGRFLQQNALNDDTDSIASTTATSTVWDELDELKNRIRLLESTGPKPISNGAALSIESSDRPRTGTTQTTQSTSPLIAYNDFSPAFPDSFSKRASCAIHPLLQSGLSKTKSVVSADVYQALHSSASDALQLAAMAREAEMQNERPSSASLVNGLTVSEKRIRRKADNLCRSLTELCIALCETPPSNRQLDNRTLTRPSSRDSSLLTNGNGDNSPLNYLEQRRRLLETSRPSSKLLSRSDPPHLLNRAATTSNNHYAPITLDSNRRASIQGTSGTDSPIIRDRALSTNMHRSRYAPTNISPIASEQDLTLRAPSRAQTDISARLTHSPRDLRLSRDYTSRHPLPSKTGIPSSIRHVLSNNDSASSIASSRTPQASLAYLSSLATSPSSDFDIPPERSRRSSSSRGPPSTGANLAERLDAKRQQRVASATQLGSIASGSGSSTTETVRTKSGR